MFLLGVDISLKNNWTLVVESTFVVLAQNGIKEYEKPSSLLNVIT